MSTRKVLCKEPLLHSGRLMTLKPWRTNVESSKLVQKSKHRTVIDPNHPKHENFYWNSRWWRIYRTRFLPRLLLFGKIYRKKKPDRSLSGFLGFRTRIITRLFVKDAQPTLVDGYLSMDNIRSGNHLKSQQYYGCTAFVSHPRATEAREIQLTFTHQPAPARPSLLLESSTMSPIIGQTML